MPLISVVIPVYNGERTIYETVSSVLAQTYKNIELIVINDGSQDSTEEILGRLHDSRLKVFSYPNAGLSASRNRGIKLAYGKYISFLDADDLWTPDKLEAQLKCLQQEPEAAIVYSWTDFIDEDGKHLGYGIHHTATGYIFPDLLVLFFIGSGSNALFQKDVFEKVGCFDESLVSAEDWDMFLRLAVHYKFAAVPKAQILYRIVENSMSSNVLRQERESLKVITRAYASEQGKSLLGLKKITLSNLYLYLGGRALRGEPYWKNGLYALRFLWLSFINKPQTLEQTSYILTLIFKALTAIILPPTPAKTFRKALKSIGRRFSKAGPFE